MASTLISLKIGLCGAKTSFGGMQRGLLLAQGREQIVLIELADDLSLLNDVTHIERKLLDNAARLALNFHLSNWLDLAGRDDGPREIDTLDFREFFRIDLDRFLADSLHPEETADPQDCKGQHNPDTFSSFPGSHIFPLIVIRADPQKVREYCPDRMPAEELYAGRGAI